ncbi:MAG: dipeptidase [Gammaproteobacteria bacterium]
MKRVVQLLSLSASLSLLGACVSSTVVTSNNVSLEERGRELAKTLLIVDTHIDVPYRLESKPDDVSQATESGDFDYPRAKAGGLNAPFMSIYIPAEKEAEGTAKALADQLIDGVEAIAAKSPDKFAIATSTQDLIKHQRQGLISLPMGMENGAPIDGKLENLEHFYMRGIRYITLTHSKSNHICDSSYDPERQWNGLSPFGEELVEAMNDIGVMVDISHVSDDAFYDVMKIVKAPAIASHSSARHFTPGFERNMDDKMIQTLAANGGLIMINFGSTFVHQPSRDNSTALSDARDAYLEPLGLKDDEDARTQFSDNYRKTTPFLYADVSHVLDHIDHVRDLVGIDYVGIGSDYDGVGDSLPTGLKDVSTYPNLVTGLLKRGYSEQDIEKILGGNLLRVWKQVEQYAAEKQY